MIKINRQLLNEALKDCGLSRRQFAKSARLRPNTICDVLNDSERRIRITTLKKIFSALPYELIPASRLIQR